MAKRLIATGKRVGGRWTVRTSLWRYLCAVGLSCVLLMVGGCDSTEPVPTYSLTTISRWSIVELTPECTPAAPTYRQCVLGMLEVPEGVTVGARYVLRIPGVVSIEAIGKKMVVRIEDTAGVRVRKERS